ncbi:MAG: autotransporter-associated beta strand repeat family protein, partial [Verrucomicrobiales bacterium]|nr:autotransporter-associated beta strand repeat family protein [Verrucomicrobiales bacterium]
KRRRSLHPLFVAVPCLAAAVAAASGAPLVWDPAMSQGAAVGGDGVFSGNPGELVWWTGTADAAWTDATGTDTAVLARPNPPGPAPAPHTVTIPAGTVITANGLTFAGDAYTLTGAGQFNFRNNTSTAAAPAVLSVPSGITGQFSAANNQNGGTLPGITITGGGTLLWGAASNGTKIILEGGTTVNSLPGGQRLGGGTSQLNSGTYRLPADAGAIDTIYDSAVLTSGPAGGAAVFDLNGSSETLGAISGTFTITNSGTQPAGLTLTGNGIQTWTGTLTDGSQARTSLTLSGTVNAAGTGFTSVNNNLVQVIGHGQTYSGDTILRRGTLRLAYNNPAAPGSGDAMLYHDLPPFAPGDSRGRLIFGGGAPGMDNTGTGGRVLLDLVGAAGAANHQHFNGTILEPWSAAGISFTPTSGGSFVLDLGPLTRGAGGMLNITSLTNLTVLTPTGSAGAALTENGVPWLTVAGSDWAVKDSTNSRLAVPPASFYEPALAESWPDGAHVNQPSGVNTRLPSDTAVSSFRLNVNERRSVNLGGHTLTVPALLLGSGMANAGTGLGGGFLTSPSADFLFIHQANTTFRYSGLAATLRDNGSGPVNFTKSGTGASCLTSDNLFSGTLSVAQGTLILTGENQPAATLIQGNMTNSSAGPLPVLNPSITLLQLGNESASGSIGAGPVTIGGLASLAVKRSDLFTLENPVGGSGHFQQAGSGTVILTRPSADYAWRGDTTVSAGILELDNTTNDDSKIPNLSALRLAGGTVRLRGGSHLETVSRVDLNAGASRLERSAGATARFRLNAINGIGTTTTAGTAGATLDFSEAGLAETDSPASNQILGTAARLTVAGADWAAPAISGDDSPIQSFAAYQNLNPLPGTDTAHSLASSGTVALTGNRTTATLKIAASGAPATVDIGSGKTLTLSAGGLLLTGDAPISLTGGTLGSATPGNPELIVHNHAAAPVSLASGIAFNPVGTGPAHLSFSGPGTTVLGGNNRYGGNTYLNGGVVSVASEAQLGGSNGTVGIQSSVMNSPTVTLTSSTLPAGFGPGSRLLGQTVNSVQGSTVTLSGNAATSLTGGAPAAWASGGTLVFNKGSLRVTSTFSLTESNSGGTGGTALLNRALVLNGTGGTIEVADHESFTLTGNITGPGGLRKTGPGTLVLANPNGGNFTATGPCRIAEGAVRMEGAANGLPFNSNLSLEAAASLDLNGINQTLGSISGGGSISNSSPEPAILTVGTTFADSEFSGTLTDGGGLLSLTKTGTSHLRLSSANSYSGPTLIEAGILTVAVPGGPEAGSATGFGLLTVGVAGTLAGAGRLDNMVVVSGEVNPGEAADPALTGTLEIGSSISFHPNSHLVLDLAGPAPAEYDSLHANSSLSLADGQTITLRLQGYIPAAGQVFQLVGAPSLSAADINFILPPLPPHLEWDTTEFPSSGAISVELSDNLYR